VTCTGWSSPLPHQVPQGWGTPFPLPYGHTGPMHPQRSVYRGSSCLGKSPSVMLSVHTWPIIIVREIMNKAQAGHVRGHERLGGLLKYYDHEAA
jgi:hypothetical protein